MDLTGWIWTAIVVALTWVPAEAQGDAFYFSAQPADVRVVEGDSATLRCDVSHRQAVAFYWTLDGEPVRNTSRRFQRGSELHITRVDPSKDLGEFKCIATNVTTGFSIASQGAQLNILCKAVTDGFRLAVPPFSARPKADGTSLRQGY